ncbi:ubiquitin-like protein ISG15 [Centroberyx affinis]|uniref:ubiquitin-like protein ISG15 n=1 Tax=Centroberyx affinis TaxID=166261 RepID=UPI003A5C3311
MELIITMLNGEHHSLKVQPDTTVASLKSLVHQIFKVSPEKQRLKHGNGQKIDLSDDSRSVSYYGLKHGSQVMVLVTEPATPATVQVFLKNEKGQMRTFEITPAETVDDFKLKVQRRDSVPADQQRLIYQGRQMDSGKLWDYGVQAGSTIHLTLRLRGG